MAHYFWGEDTYEARQAITKLVAKEQAQVRWLDRDDFAAGSVVEQLGQSSSLFGKDMVVVRDPSQLPKAIQDDLVTLLSQENGVARDEVVLWERAVPDKRGKLWRKFSKTTNAQEFSHGSEQELQQWLTAEAKQRQGVLEEKAAPVLIARVGVDRWRLLAELERLLLTAGDKPVTVVLVEELTEESVEVEIFAMLDALVRGDKKAVGQGIEALLAAGNSEFYLLSMLAYQFRTLLTIAAGQRAGKSPEAIAREARLHPFVVRKQGQVARQFSEQQLLDALTRVAAVDVAIKQGKVEARTGLLMLVLGLVKSASLQRSEAGK